MKQEVKIDEKLLYKETVRRLLTYLVDYYPGPVEINFFDLFQATEGKDCTIRIDEGGMMKLEIIEETTENAENA